MLVYDALYAWCREAQAETHGWYPARAPRLKRRDREQDAARRAAPTRAEAFRYWLKLGFVSFGGPAGQIAIMHRELVDERRWISERRFLHALNYCMVLPGPGGAAARDLHRLAHAPDLGRHRRRRRCSCCRRSSC